GDGKIDVFVSSMFGRCQLYRNDGGTFTDVTLDVLGRTPWGATGSRALDYNNDGRLGLFVVDMHSDMWMGLDRAHRSLKFARDYGTPKDPKLYGPPATLEPAHIALETDLIKKMDTRHEELLFGNALYRNEGHGKF